MDGLRVQLGNRPIFLAIPGMMPPMNFAHDLAFFPSPSTYVGSWRLLLRS